MDMKIDGKRIRFEREQRAWSQEHLAQVTGLGLRTIQRIESVGLASYESVKAIASAFNIAASDLRSRDEAAIQPPPTPEENSIPFVDAKPESVAPRPTRTSRKLVQLIPAVVLAMGILGGTTAVAKLSSELWWLAALILASSTIVAGAISTFSRSTGLKGMRNTLLLAATCFTASGIVAQIDPASLGLMIAVLGGGNAVVLAKRRDCSRPTSGMPSTI